MAALPLVFTGVDAFAGNKDDPHVSLVRDAKDPRWVYGSVRVDAPPEAVFERLSRVNTWPTFLTDIKRLTVKQHEGRNWQARIATRTMDCGEHDYRISVEPNRTVKLVIDATGIDAWGSIRVDPRKEGSTAKFSLFIQTTGVIGWFIPESTVRARQEQMVRQDLTDLAKASRPK